jgi:hypothetical protein
MFHFTSNDLRQMNHLCSELWHRATGRLRIKPNLLVVCAWCRQKQRDEKGHWHPLPAYPCEECTDPPISHGICPECMAQVTLGLPTV